MLLRLAIGLAAMLAVTSQSALAAAQAPRDGARFTANAEIEFTAGPAISGEGHRLRLARDPALQDVVYEELDSYEIGMWFVVPQKAGLAAGHYYWQACWTQEGAEQCTDVRSLEIAAARIATLTLGRAKELVRAVYDGHGAAWEVGNGKRYNCRRVTRIRMACRPRAWAGDTVVTAKLQMVNRMNRTTRVTGYIEYFSEYCADVTPHKDCTTRKRVDGSHLDFR